MTKIITSFDYPPIPIRHMDWSAHLDGYEPGDPIGHGKTEAEAIADLTEQTDLQLCDSDDGDEMCSACDCWKHTRAMCG